MRVLFYSIIILLISFVSHSQIPSWGQVGQTIVGDSIGDHMGRCKISKDGNTLAVGASNANNQNDNAGVIKVFEWQNNQWVQKGNSLYGPTGNQFWGYSFDMDDEGNTLVIGEPYNQTNGNNAGRIIVYEWDGNSWVQKGQHLYGDTTNHEYGFRVAVSGNGNVIIVNGEDPNISNAGNAGYIDIFEFNGTVWQQRGSRIIGDYSGDQFGFDVDLNYDGNFLVSSGLYHDGLAISSGQVKVYQWSGLIWQQLGWDLYGQTMSERFGWSCAIDSSGTAIAVGIIRYDTPNINNGAIAVYDWNGSMWIQRGNHISGEYADDLFGWDLTFSDNGNYIAGGSQVNSDNGHHSGQARVFEWSSSNNSWMQINSDIDGADSLDRLSYVSINNDASLIATGAWSSNINGYQSGYVKVFKPCNKTFHQIAVASCGSYTVPSGSSTYYSDGTYYDTLVNSEGCDSILTILLDIQDESGVDVVQACGSYTWMDGNTYTTDENTATHTLTAQNGCDSVVTLNLSITPMDTNVTQNGSVLQSWTGADTYQWIDCNTMQAIPGAVTVNFVPSENGSYAVVLSNGTCTDTSNCHAYNMLSLEERNSFFFSVYPNPNNGNFTIHFEQLKEEVEIQIFDSQGKLVYENAETNISSVEVKTQLAHGLYLLKVISETKNKAIPLQVE